MSKTICFTTIVLGLAALPLCAQTSADNPRLKKALESHPDADGLSEMPGMAGKHLLGLGCTLNGIQGAHKGDKEGVPLRIHFLSIPFLDAGSQDLVVFCQ